MSWILFVAMGCSVLEQLSAEVSSSWGWKKWNLRADFQHQAVFSGDVPASSAGHSGVGAAKHVACGGTGLLRGSYKLGKTWWLGQLYW